MPNRNNDDAARALEAMSGGQADGVAGKPPPTPAANPRAPRPAAPASPTNSSRPTAPRPTAPGGAAPPPKPQRPSAPIVPPARPAAPVVGPARPTLPAASPTGQRPAALAGRPVGPAYAPAPDTNAAVDDDDAVIVPAPDASVFMHKPQYASRPTHRAPGFGQSIEARRTFIPILLTAGLIMLAVAALHFAGGENNPFAPLPLWLGLVMALFGLLLWGIAVANMLVVRQMLKACEPATGGAAAASR